MSNEIKVKYVNAPDYRKIPATGAWGGVSPNAEVVVNFFVEFQSTPESTILKFDESGKIEEKRDEGEENQLTRELLVGVVMRPDIARSVGQFLIRNAEKAEESIAQKEKSEA